MKRHVLVNFAILFGFIGFIGYLFMIVSGFFGCCAGLTTPIFHKIVIFVLVSAVVLFGICMYNNCCTASKREKKQL